jgi:hypothetical protein
LLKDFGPYCGHYPTFYKGILCSNGENGTTTKGTVLLKFLEKVKAEPKIIVVIDDKKKNLQDIREYFAKQNPEVRLVLMEYRGAFDCIKEDISAEQFEDFWNELAKQVEVM